MLPPDEHTPLPPIILANDGLPHEIVSPQLGQYLRPHYPVDCACDKDRNANYAVQVVRQTLVHALPVTRGHERCDDKVDVADKEKRGDGPCRAEGRVPVVLFGAPVEVEEGGGDEDVDDGERVRDYAGEY